MQNVGTAYAVKRAVIDGEPLTERVVTLTGESVSRRVTSGRVWAHRCVTCWSRPVFARQ
jgi:electron transport complex protein RnfC